MTQNNHQTGDEHKELAAKNKRLGIILGLVAAGFYVGFILMYWK